MDSVRTTTFRRNILSVLAVGGTLAIAGCDATETVPIEYRHAIEEQVSVLRKKMK